MKDKLGIYYHPFPQNKKIRMYIRKTGREICFRMWNSEDPKMWEEHEWVPYEAIKQAAAIYKRKSFDPGMAYDMDTARALIREHGIK